MSNIAYVRVSTIDQSTERQTELIENVTNIDEWFIEKKSGKNTERVELQNMLKYIRHGDTIYIESFSRLSRSTKDLISLMETIKEKDVELVSIKENLDTSTATGMLLVKMIASINEFERENLLERQREGIEIAKKKGKYKGRKKIEISGDIIDYYEKWKRREITKKEIINNIGVSRTTLYRMFIEIESNIGGQK